ncbi:hypothetical protein SFC88_03675 [Nocardioides sp. HM23]|uniref:hypothetical protein n=1 Tax=Nocardioides bizhenqiangii TaxID=3095076 RepID=UPI002ACA3760|nr:hypothetical protein [Nocardioides sp. HM23]MDZ5619909.1 hypothetical protein [Nocardioides sp. HM23]
MPDIADQLDAAIGAAPTEAPGLASTLALGRRALRRRRLAYGVGAAATALVIGGTAWAVSPDDSSPNRSDDQGFVGEPSESSASDSEPEPPQDGARNAGMPWAGEDAARVRSGQLDVRPGWQVVDDLSAPGMVAVEVAKGDRRQWFLFGDAMTIASLRAPALGYDSFEEWVDVNAPLLEDQRTNGGTEKPGDWPGVPRDDLVVLEADDSLLPLDGVTIVEQRRRPDLGDSFATAGDTSAVALVEKDGEQWYVLARRGPDIPEQYIAVPRADGGEDLDAFLELARQRYAEGGGGLL